MIDKKSEWQHIYPLKDDKKHELEGLCCDCNPKIDWDKLLVIHNAWDFREVKEELRENETNIY